MLSMKQKIIFVVLFSALTAVLAGPAPGFDTDFENGTYTEGASVTLICLARGESPMTYAWHDESEAPIRNTESISIVESSTESSLVIKNVRLSDAGMYTCNAQNKHGLSSKLFRVNVTPRNGKNDTDFKIVNVTTTSMQFAIGGARLTEYVEVRYKESRAYKESPVVYLKLSSEPNNVYTVDKLIPARLYSFQFRVVSPERNFEGWSREFNVTLLPDAPELIIRRQENRVLELEWFRRVDDIMLGAIDKYEISYYTVSMLGGNTWVKSNCNVTIILPSCQGSSYIISGLQLKAYYHIEVRAHTESGYGEHSTQKIYTSA